MMRCDPKMLICVGFFLFVALNWGAFAWGQEGQAESVCITCHGGQSGHLGEPVALWRGSIHAENGISCHGCHGGDPTDMAMAMSPERGFIGVPGAEEIPDFCGRCHVGVKEDYLASAHGQALGAGGPQCATCHGAHQVARATPELINPQDCTRCHEYGRAEEIKEAVAATDQRIAQIDEVLANLHRKGIAVKEMSGTLFSIRNEFHRLFHSVDVEKVRQQTADFQSQLDQLQAKIDAIRADLGQRRIWGVVVVGLLTALTVLFILIRKSYKEEELREEG